MGYEYATALLEQGQRDLFGKDVLVEANKPGKRLRRKLTDRVLEEVLSEFADSDDEGVKEAWESFLPERAAIGKSKLLVQNNCSNKMHAHGRQGRCSLLKRTREEVTGWLTD